jgi:hypothetical protein
MCVCVCVSLCVTQWRKYMAMFGLLDRFHMLTQTEVVMIPSEHSFFTSIELILVVAMVVPCCADVLDELHCHQYDEREWLTLWKSF